MMGMIGITYCDSDCDSDKEDSHCDYGDDHAKMFPEVAKADGDQKSYELEQVHWQRPKRGQET